MVCYMLKMVCSVDKYKHFGQNGTIGFLLHVSVIVLHVLTFMKLIYISALSKCFFIFLMICKSNSPTFRLTSNCEKEHQVNLVIYTSSPISLQRFNPLAHYLLTYRIART